jgi:hypothetical protein
VVGLETAPCIPHIAGFLIQLVGLASVLRDTQAAFIRKPKVVAANGIPKVTSLPVELIGFVVVLPIAPT